jgi:hypothetical protein
VPGAPARMTSCRTSMPAAVMTLRCVVSPSSPSPADFRRHANITQMRPRRRRGPRCGQRRELPHAGPCWADRAAADCPCAPRGLGHAAPRRRPHGRRPGHLLLRATRRATTRMQASPRRRPRTPAPPPSARSRCSTAFFTGAQNSWAANTACGTILS